MTTLPLDGFTVVDFTRVLSGPFCTMQLADMGARVIKIEQRGTGDDTRAWGPPFIHGESSYFLSVNRNKESVTLDLKHPEARRILDPLLGKADVVVENFRPGTMQRLSLDYETLSARHPRLIYCSISGFGQTGPRRSEGGYDAVAQAEGGLMSITGPEEGAGYRLGVAVSDIVSGMFAMQGVLLALIARGRTGHGQLVDVSLLDSTAALLTYQAGIYFATGGSPPRMGNRHPTIAPYETFTAADGELVVAVGNDDQWRRFCGVIGQPELAQDARFSENRLRIANYDQLRPILADALRPRARGEWVPALKAAGIPCGAVRSVTEVLRDPQLIAREMVQSIEHPVAGTIGTLGPPVHLSATPAVIRRPPPTLGQHTDDILRRDVGLNDGEISALRAAKAI